MEEEEEEEEEGLVGWKEVSFSLPLSLSLPSLSLPLSLYRPFSFSLSFSLPQPAPQCSDGAKVPHMMLNPTPSITSAEFEQKWLALPVR